MSGSQWKGLREQAAQLGKSPDSRVICKQHQGYRKGEERGDNWQTKRVGGWPEIESSARRMLAHMVADQPKNVSGRTSVVGSGMSA